MSWMQKLYDTYERCAGAPQFEKVPLNPVSSQYQDTQIQITLDGDGKFLRAEMRQLADTLIPVSEDSATRSGKKPWPNPLTDKLCYCAADIGKYGGDGRRYEGYAQRLKGWCESEFSDTKARAVLSYVEKRTLTRDLINEKVLEYKDGKLSRLKIAPKKALDAKDAWIRWRVESRGTALSNTWEDMYMFERWRCFEESLPHPKGTCDVTGKCSRLARFHPRGIRFNSDRAKLISVNDTKGFTYRGRFAGSDQATAVAYDVTQKAHNALRWLIRRHQGTRTGSQVYVAWSVNGAEVPDPQRSTAAWLGLDNASGLDDVYEGDAGQLIALRLKSKLRGYRADLGDTSGVVVMGLDTAAKDSGRLAIIFYRELSGSEFLDRIERWHLGNAWYHAIFDDKFRDPGNGKAFRYVVGAPSPVSIAEAAYGLDRKDLREDDVRVLRATTARLMPCIVEGTGVPKDLALACFRRAVCRTSHKKTDGREERWEQCLGITCALFRGGRREEGYKMSLEENRTTRNYLFGRLLAIAENIEQRALYLANEKRDTNAAKLMQRFADRPSTTWRNIELALTPYKARLRAKRPSVLLERDKLMDAVVGMFKGDDFVSDSKLSGEFLLGYHCQRAALWLKAEPASGAVENDDAERQGDNA